MELDFAGPLLLTWGAKNVYSYAWIDFQNNIGTNNIKLVINLLRKFVTLHGIPRIIRTDQASGFIWIMFEKFFMKKN